MADAQNPTGAPAQEEKKELTKSALKKMQKEKEKADRKAANAAKNQANQQAQASKQTEEENNGNFGVLPLIRSQTRERRVFANVKDLDASKADQTVLIRARAQNLRPTGANMVFIVLRQRLYTAQAILMKGADVPKSMVEFAKKITKESIIDIEGTVVVPKEKIASCSQQDIEIHVKKIFLVTAAEQLPLQLEDLSRPIALLNAQETEIAAIDTQIADLEKKVVQGDESEEQKSIQKQLKELAEKKQTAKKYVSVELKTRLDHRVIDMRTPANQAIFRIQSAVGQLFREYLVSKDFTEIHTPKLIGCASEGGSEVFQVKYFDRWAYLAQSPQLYKQMAITADMERVFEIGPIFRAENSFTHRHMTEFMGLDLEMSFYEHYHEVLDVLDELFTSIFDGISTRFAKELEIISQQYPFEPLKYNKPSLRLKYSDIVALLREAGETHGDLEDLNTTQEKFVGKLVKAKHGVDFYIVDRFPTNIRPFYTMVSPDDSNYSNSYDFFLRGEEIMSGAQRVHDPAMLTQRATEKGVPISGIKDYVDAFKYGAAPHAGGGIGLERVTMLYLGLSNIRQTSMFPRDPVRLTP
eukprot:TRINITY_DN10275_c0_g1_i2.p1 TRINITY_DN10275_c0_g1~~TRINITY_DN10275_c0_g1_i2.p1  ORF type:complete len:599 (+),score=188.35 TRINITY_DN10275_c0_g1_i2:52-1797(+)